MRSIHIEQTIECICAHNWIILAHTCTATVHIVIIWNAWIHTDAKLSSDCCHWCHILATTVATALRIRLSVLSGKFHSLLFLSLIAEPHAHHILFQIQFLRDGSDLFTGWSRLDGKISFERTLFRRCDGSPFSWKKASI